jgi:hypothetical protein
MDSEMSVKRGAFGPVEPKIFGRNCWCPIET